MMDKISIKKWHIWSILSLFILSGIIFAGPINIDEGLAEVMDWTGLQSYPAACPAGSMLTQLDDTVTCTDISGIIHANGEDNIIYLTLDENEGTVAYDSSREENDGTISGNPIWVSGKFGSALDFDGTGDCIEVLTKPPQDNGSIVLWFNADDITNYEQLFNHLEGAANRIYFGFNSNKLWYRFGGLSDTNADTTLTTDTWYHAVLTWNDSASGNVQVYLNGETDDTPQTGSLSATEASIHFGSNQNCDGSFFNGTMDAVKIYNRTLTAEEIRMEYISELASHPSTGHFLERDVPYETKQRWYNSTGDICCCEYVNSTGDWLRTTNISLCS